jgi:molybdopterin converting factor subunit 1
MPRELKVQVLLFAAVAEQAGWTDQRMNLPEGSRVSDLRQVLVQTQPQIETSLSPARIAVNEVFASEDTVLQEGDVVAIIPPVAGG